MPGRILVAVSNDESFVILKTNTGFYEFYSVTNNYELIFEKSVKISRYTLKKGVILTDDKTLIISICYSSAICNIVVIDVESLSFVYVADQDGSVNNQFDFHVFDAKYDLFITLIIRNSLYYMQLRSISNLTLFDEN
jgi:hypothetical protein